MKDDQICHHNEELINQAEISNESLCQHEIIVRLKRFTNASAQAPEAYKADQLKKDIEYVLELQEELEKKNDTLHVALDVFRPHVRRESLNFIIGFFAGLLTMMIMMILNSIFGW